ncbi:hypothetical protein QTH91_17675 [Variovorax dokdonensis]|uniref:Uncharacterized protein n=1 Tax=Variovorax dokdonensis TaxID=344883 RepID=A0ABT7NEH7_9BURK|nr:hypothetical protein [Variovorax dokdonensis]MDM0046327.1 hypothetical protein [Variovorax dokdonensis]
MILVKTDAGQLALKDRSLGLTPRQRSAFILFDGKRSVADVVGAGLGVSEQDVDQLVLAGLLASADGMPARAAAAEAPSKPQAAVGSDAATEERRTPQQRYQDAYPIATRLTAGLGLRGFKLNLQVEGATRYEDLVALAPKIRAAVGPDASAELDRALDV